MNTRSGQWTLSFVAVSLLCSCQGARIRQPASTPEDGVSATLSRLATLQGQVEHLQDDLSLSSQSATDPRASVLKSLEEELASLRQAVRAPSRNPGLPSSVQVPYEDEAYTTQDTLVLSTLEKFRVSKDQAPKGIFYMSHGRSKYYRIKIINRPDEKLRDALNGGPEMGIKNYEALLSCDGTFDLAGARLRRTLKGVHEARFRLYDNRVADRNLYFIPSESTTRCEMRLEDSIATNGEKGQYALILQADPAQSAVKSAHSKTEFCFLPQIGADQASKPEGLFVNPEFHQLTCPIAVEKIEPLPVPLDGLNAKIEMLLGQKLPEEVLRKQDPYIDLDFSKAPRLDTILISYLVFRADFSGTLLSRLIEWHAEHGTSVKIMVSDVIALEKDKKLFHRLMAEHPNIKVSLYKFKNPGKFTVREKFSELHRSMHVKLFITTSERDPSANAVIIGGRNVHDAFYFREPQPRLPSWKGVVDYIGGDEAFVHWNDFEVKVGDASFAKRIAQQYYALWNQDAETFLVRNYVQSMPVSAQQLKSNFFDSSDSAPIIRHMISVPYKDKMQLEKFYVSLIDSAQKSIVFSTPYFNLTKPIQMAVQRAVDRGVKIRLITRIELDGDTADIILSDVNKQAINKFKDKIEVFEYTEPNTILHSKFVLIDGYVSFVGGVNLNQRSFIHDTENGMLLYSRKFYDSMEKLFEHYQTLARPVAEKQKSAFWKKFVIRAFQDAL
jgi:phosphatidylserine/phosphatidylglycerophosphate/cardiolipin synthase-like enzyme